MEVSGGSLNGVSTAGNGGRGGVGGHGGSGAAGGLTGGEGGNSGPGGVGGDAGGGALHMIGGTLRVTNALVTGSAIAGAGGDGVTGGDGGQGGRGSPGGSGTAGKAGGIGGVAGDAGAASGGAFFLEGVTAVLEDTSVAGQATAGAGGDGGGGGGGGPGGNGGDSDQLTGGGGSGADGGDGGGGSDGTRGGDARGGGVYAKGGSLTLDRATIYNGSAVGGIGGAGGLSGNGGRGGDGGSGTFEGAADPTTIGHGGNGGSVPQSGIAQDGGDGLGGGAYVENVLFTIRNATISGNRAFGDLRGAIPDVLINSPGAGGDGNPGGVSGTDNNIIGSTPLHGVGQGGALYVKSGVGTVTFSTFASNQAQGAVASEGDGGGVVVAGGLLKIDNTIVADNTATGENPDVQGAFVSEGRNLVETVGSAGGFGVSGDLLSADPQLGALGYFGGANLGLFTHVPQNGSPVFNAGAGTSADTDARGLVRPAGLIPDIGAVEIQGPFLIGGRLLVDGTTGNDTITAGLSSGDPTHLEVTVNGSVVYDGPLADVTEFISLSGHGGNDVITVNPDVPLRASLDGGTGNDLLIGAGDADTIVGGAGNDTAIGGGGADQINGNAGNDVLGGGPANDTVSGDAGHDVLLGDDGVDSLLGGDGRDILVGGNGADGLKTVVGRKTTYTPYLKGGAGEDALIAARTDYDDLTLPSNRAAWTNLGARWSAPGLAYATRIADVQRPGGTGGARLSPDTMHDDGEIDVSAGEGQADWFVIQNSTGLNIVKDVVTDKKAESGVAEQIFDLPPPGIVASKAVKFAGGILTVTGTSAADFFTLSRDIGGNILVTDKIGYTLAPVGGGAVPLASATKIVLKGLGGDDVLEIDLGSGLFNIPFEVDGGAGAKDLIRVFGGNGADNFRAGKLGIDLNDDTAKDVTLTTVEGIEFVGLDGNDTLLAGGGNSMGDPAPVPVTLSGGAGDDSLLGGAKDDVLTGGLGDNFFAGGGGKDVNAESAADLGADDLILSLSENMLFRKVVGSGLTNRFLVDVETVQLTGGEGNDSLDGSASPVPVVFFGLGGTDILRGSPFADKLDGGDGDDEFSPGAGKDTVTGGAGTDLLVSGVADNATLTNAMLRFTDAAKKIVEQDKLAAVERARLTGNNGNNVINAAGFAAGSVTIFGGAGNDSLTGGSKNDLLEGEDGKDTLVGGAGDDDLHGGNDSDSLSGGAGNDGLFGGSAPDTLTGGANSDRFLFQTFDVITDLRSEDAKLTFVDGDKSWRNDEILAFDVGIAALHHTVRGIRLLKPSPRVGGEMTFRRFTASTETPGAGADNNSQGLIRVYDGAFASAGDSPADFAVHELGHNWDNWQDFLLPSEYQKVPQFRALSGWQPLLTGLPVPPGFTRATSLKNEDQPWIYLSTATFAGKDGYGKTNPYEDFASCLEMYFKLISGNTTANPKETWLTKWTFIDNFLKSTDS